MQIPLDVCPIGQYVLIKFLPPANPDAERISVIRIKFYGFARKAIFLPVSEDATETRAADAVIMATQVTSGVETPTSGATPGEDSRLPVAAPALDAVAPDGPVRSDANADAVPGQRVLYHVLEFLVAMARDQVVDKRQPAATGRPPNLDMQSLNIHIIWTLFRSLSDVRCQILCLQLLHALFPFLASDREAIKDGAEELFKHLCHLVDNNSEPIGAEDGEGKIRKRLIETAR